MYRLVSEKTIEENILTKSDQKRQLDYLAIQSGGFNTDFLQKFNLRELLGLQGANSTAFSMHIPHGSLSIYCAQGKLWEVKKVDCQLTYLLRKTCSYTDISYRLAEFIDWCRTKVEIT